MKILYLFTRDWNKEITDYSKGLVPSHRIFGYAELEKMGHDPSVCRSPAPFKKWMNHPRRWKIYQALFVLVRQKQFDCIFAVNEASALPSLVLKFVGLVRLPIIIFNTGLMHPRNQSGFRKKMWQLLLPLADAVVSQTQMELESTPVAFGLKKERQHFIPMLVDIDFLKTDRKVPTADYCLAVGTNEAKDYPTLLKAFPRNEKLIVVTDAYNAAIIEKHLEPGMPVQVLQAVPIKKLKEMYCEAKAIFNPLGDTPYGSGHTVVLENMVLGKTVLVTRVGGMTDYFEDNTSAVGVRPNDVEDWRQKIESFLADPAKFAHIGKRAQEWVRRFSSWEFARKLETIAARLVPACTEQAAGRQDPRNDPSRKTADNADRALSGPNPVQSCTT